MSDRFDLPGRRAGPAVARLADPCGKEVAVLEGGTSAWITAAGFRVVANVQSRWSLERQVRLGAGVMVLLGVTERGLRNLTLSNSSSIAVWNA